MLARVVLSALWLALMGAADAQPRLLSVPTLDLTRYAGTWHEVARLPNPFQRDCMGDVTATYTPLPGGQLAVVNRCRVGEAEDAAWETAEGVAWPVDDTQAKLKVSFVPEWLRWLPVGRGNYWVVELDPDYRWAVVGAPSRRTLWVLSRTPSLPPDVLEGILGRAKEMGFATGRVIVSPAQGAPRPGLHAPAATVRAP